MNKKYISGLVVVVIVAIGGYFLLQSSGTSDEVVAKIASTTQKQISEYTTSTRQQLKYELKNRQLNNDTSGAEVEQLGVSFQTPWGEPTSIDDRGQIVGVNFSNNNSALISKESGSPQQALRDIDSELQSQSKSSLQLFEQKLGQNFSGYEFMNYILSVEPDDVGQSETEEEATRKSYALTLRSTMVPAGQPYRFSSGSKKGFVFAGDSRNHIQVWLDNEGYSLILSGDVSKEAVDTAIRTLERKNPTSNSADNSNFFSE